MVIVMKVQWSKHIESKNIK